MFSVFTHSKCGTKLLSTVRLPYFVIVPDFWQVHKGFMFLHFMHTFSLYLKVELGPVKKVITPSGIT